MDTIYAQATVAGRAGVSVLRVSGPHAHRIAGDVAGSLPQANRAVLRHFRGSSGDVIDQGLVLLFDGPQSFTGEDVVEFHLHGSIAIVRAMLERLSEFDGTRPAEPGEFTRRALENEKLDLSQVEGLADLIEAETEAQRKQALRVLSGHLGDLVEGWRADLIRAAALLEATIDFADEEVPVDVTPEVAALLEKVAGELAQEVAGSRAAERIRAGFQIAIIGPPNVGKSTLLNALAGREAAITSEIAGTTRDVVEVRMDLGGIPATFLDTAGLRDTDDRIENLGIERAVQRARDADLRIFLKRPQDALVLVPEDRDIVLHPKADQFPGVPDAVSGKTGKGVRALLDRITARLEQETSGVGVATHARHRVAMSQAFERLADVKETLGHGPDRYDIAAEELRSAVRSLETVVGRIGVENLLDEIFSSFCIGK